MSKLVSRKGSYDMSCTVERHHWNHSKAYRNPARDYTKADPERNKDEEVCQRDSVRAIIPLTTYMVFLRRQLLMFNIDAAAWEDKKYNEESRFLAHVEIRSPIYQSTILFGNGVKSLRLEGSGPRLLDGKAIKRNEGIKENEVESNGDNVLPEVTDPDTVMEEVTKCMKTPRATLSIYWEPHVQGIPIPVEGTYYDTIDEAIDVYTKYADMAGFEVKKSGQRLTKSGAVQHKYIMCNREGVPKGINVDTLDPEYCDKPKRNTTHICKEIYDETVLKERFDKIVWNMFIEPLKFEEKWGQLIEDFGLQKSENSFFKSFTSPEATLVSFMMSYESAMERQRYRQETLDFKTIDAAPKCETKLAIERHAARVFAIYSERNPYYFSTPILFCLEFCFRNLWLLKLWNQHIEHLHAPLQRGHDKEPVLGS
ncbi:FAR1 DNA binding domain-containing protein [Tanacetum coccineum]